MEPQGRCIHIFISVSVICLDLLNLCEQIVKLEKANIDKLHIDVADGQFVPNFGLPIDVLPTIKKFTDLPIEVHLMTINPEKFLDRIMDYGAESVLIHTEKLVSSFGYYKSFINEYGKRSLGIVISPGQKINFDVICDAGIKKVTVMTVVPGFKGQPFVRDSLDIIKSLDHFRTAYSQNYIIEADGAVGFDTVNEILANGCDSFVLGSTMFRNGIIDINTILRFKKIIQRQRIVNL